MPTISHFQGVDIIMRVRDHRPPHFHVKYGERIASIEIGTWNYAAGELPNRVYKLVVNWGKSHEAELKENWQRTERGELPEKIRGF